MLACTRKWLDARDNIATFGDWRWDASVHDVLSILFWPTVLILDWVVQVRCTDILADLLRLSCGAESLVWINIQDGTKGGRAGASAHRWIAIDDDVRGALEFANQVSPADSRNLSASNEGCLTILQEIVRP